MHGERVSAEQRFQREDDSKPTATVGRKTLFFFLIFLEPRPSEDIPQRAVRLHADFVVI